MVDRARLQGDLQDLREQRPGAATATAVVVGIVSLWGSCELCLFSGSITPLPYALPLLAGIWTRRRWLLWSMACALAAMAAAKVFWFVPEWAEESIGPWGMWGMKLTNIALTAGVVHLIINLRTGLEKRHGALARANTELYARNQLLAQHQSSIDGQNQELAWRAREMEEQSDQLAAHGRELDTANQELQRRQRMLEILLEAARSLRPQRAVMRDICRSVLQLLEPVAVAAAVTERRAEELAICAHAGFALETPLKESCAFERSFAAVVMQEGKTGCLQDTSLRPDLQVGRFGGVNGMGSFRSVLATPLRVGGGIVGAVEVYSDQPVAWSAEQFRLIEWVAAQCSLILEIVQLQQELEMRRRQAEDLAARKTEFLAAVSHDIRTPANAITLMAELITRTAVAGGPDSAGEIATMARELQANSRSLVDLVSDVLDLGRLDCGKHEISEEPFSLQRLVEAQVRHLAPLARAKGLELVTSGQLEGIWLRSDRMKMARVLANLIGNAIKFTDVGRVSISARIVADVGVDLQVADTGAGIPKEHLGNIFDEFVQLANPARQRSKGAGMGLAICRRLADAMGCRLGVQSEVGKGSTFTLAVPHHLLVPPASQTRRELAIAATSAQPLAGLRVLLVEDHDTTRRVTAKLLAARGAAVIQAPRGATAMQLLTHQCVDVLLLDMMLPDMDGREVLRSVVERRPRELLCILAVTGDATAARQGEIRSLGADGLIIKPIQVESLVNRICELTARGNAKKATVK